LKRKEKLAKAQTISTKRKKEKQKDSNKEIGITDEEG